MVTRTFIKDEERFAEWYRLVRYVYEKSPRATLNWSVYRNSGLENKYQKGVVIINTGPRQAVVTATLDDLKRSRAKQLEFAQQRTTTALNQLMYVREPSNDQKPPLSRDKLGRVNKGIPQPKKRTRRRALVIG